MRSVPSDPCPRAPNDGHSPRVTAVAAVGRFDVLAGDQGQCGAQGRAVPRSRRFAADGPDWQEARPSCAPGYAPAGGLRAAYVPAPAASSITQPVKISPAWRSPSHVAMAPTPTTGTEIPA